LIPSLGRAEDFPKMDNVFGRIGGALPVGVRQAFDIPASIHDAPPPLKAIPTACLALFTAVLPATAEAGRLGRAVSFCNRSRNNRSEHLMSGWDWDDVNRDFAKAALTSAA